MKLGLKIFIILIFVVGLFETSRNTFRTDIGGTIAVTSFFLIVFLVILFIIYIIIEINKYKKTEAENELVATLGAAVMRSDGVVSKKEYDIFTIYIHNKYNDLSREKDILSILNEKLKKPVKIGYICLENKDYVHYNRRFSIVRAMFRIAAAENGICEQERLLLEKTMILLSLSKVDKDYLRKEFEINYRKEEQKSTTLSNKNEYYQILGVSYNATIEEVKKRYKELCFEHHPDRYENSDETTKKYHNEKMKSINEAYNEILKSNK